MAIGALPALALCFSHRLRLLFGFGYKELGKAYQSRSGGELNQKKRLLRKDCIADQNAVGGGERGGQFGIRVRKRTRVFVSLFWHEGSTVQSTRQTTNSFPYTGREVNDIRYDSIC